MEQEHHDSHELHGPDKPTYNMVYVALTVFMIASVAATYLELPGLLHYAVLLGIMTIKAGLVVAYYMHLKYDTPLFTWILILPVLMGTAVILSLQGLAGYQ
jgi:cytochrome c oxidase subunit IV